MRFGIPKLDELVGDITPGSTVLISTIGDLGIEIVIAIIRENRPTIPVFIGELNIMGASVMFLSLTATGKRCGGDE